VVVQYSAAEITSRWRIRGKWPKTLEKELGDLKDSMMDMATFKGAVHGEAEVLAALCATGSEDYGTPKIVKEAFQSLRGRKFSSLLGVPES
jgi:hypothetical protein